MDLQTGDKIRILATIEGAEIIEVVDETHAIVDTFDGEIEINAQEVVPYQSGDVRDSFDEPIFFRQKKQTNKEENINPQKDPNSFNNRKNRFPYELDLHAESLIGDTDSRSNEEILSIQKGKVKKYLTEAIELRIQRVYIIHGIGSGRLRAEVETILHNHPQIIHYKNEYHPSYGMGATEVTLR